MRNWWTEVLQTLDPIVGDSNNYMPSPSQRKRARERARIRAIQRALPVNAKRRKLRATRKVKG